MSGTPLELDSLRPGRPGLTNSKAGVLIEACVWCMEVCGHRVGVELIANVASVDFSYAVYWLPQDIAMLLQSYNQEDAVQFGAEAIALLIAMERTGLTVIKRAATGEGIDYWLGSVPESNNELFLRSDARLEISGILNESLTNTVKRRVQQKLKQTIPTDHTFPVYIIVVEFGGPYVVMVRKDVQAT